MTNPYLHRHVSADGTVSEHMPDACPLTPYNGKRISVSGKMSKEPLLNEWVDAKGKIHKRRVGS